MDFEFKVTGDPTFSWQVLLFALLLALGWRLVIWFLESSPARIHWRRVRYGWPTAMLAWGWIVVALITRNQPSGWLSDAHAFVFSLVNLPVLPLVSAVFDVLQQLDIWLRLLGGSIAMWVGWHLLLHLAEWRAWIHAPISLKLAEREGPPVTDEPPRD